MSTKHGLLKKASRTANGHTTFTKTAQFVIETAQRIATVTKINPGPISSSVGCGDKRIKITSVPTGIKIMVRGDGAIQQVIIQTEQPQQVIDSLRVSLESKMKIVDKTVKLQNPTD